MKRIIIFLLIFTTLISGFLWFGTRDDKTVTGVVQSEIEVTEDQSEYTERYSAQIDRVAVVFEHRDYTSYRLRTNGLVREGELNTERGYQSDPDATVYILNWQKPEGEQTRYVRLTQEPDHLYFLDTDGEIVSSTPLVLER